MFLTTKNPPVQFQGGLRAACRYECLDRRRIMSTGISALYSEFTAALTEVRSTCVECSWTGAWRLARRARRQEAPRI